MKESDIEKRLVREVKRIGGRSLKWTSPGNIGVPDRIVFLPKGKVVFVELKAPGKKLRPMQERWFKILRSMGYEVYKIDSFEGVDDFITEVVSGGV